MPNGDLASGTSYEMIHIWNTVRGVIKRNLTGGTQKVWGMTLLSNGNLVSGCFKNFSISVWDLNQNNPLLRTFKTSENPFCLYALPNDDIVSGFDNQHNIVIRDVKSGIIKQVLVGHSNQVSKVEILNNGHLASSSIDGTVKIWDLVNGQMVQSFDGTSGSMSSLAILKNGNFATTSRNYGISILNLNNGQIIKELNGHKSTIFGLKVLKDGTLASSSFDNTIKLWNPNNGTLIKTLSGHSSEVWYLDVLVNGDLASESQGEIFIWS